MQVVKTKAVNKNNKTHNISGLLLALIASAAVFSGCGGGVFFDSQDPAATNGTASTSPPSATPTPGATPTPTPTPTPGTTPTPTPTPGTTPTPTPTPGATPTPTPTPAPAPVPAPAPSAGTLGKSSWAANCQSCHTNISAYGSNSSKTMSAINGGIPKMSFLRGIVSATDASNIVVYAANPGGF